MVAGSVNTYRQMRDKLRTDLNKLIRVLEIYLSDFVNSQECNKILPNIEEIMKYPFEYVDGSIEDKISYIISFNYTNTYERIYFKDENIENYIHYIHGKADIIHETEDNNMVLGIDEFLPNDRKDKDIEFIAFKKFSSIHSHTSCCFTDLEDLFALNLDFGMNKLGRDTPFIISAPCSYK